jgi:hypothetical protein
MIVSFYSGQTQIRVADWTLQVPRIWLGMPIVAAFGFAVRQKARVPVEPLGDNRDADLDAIRHDKLTMDIE